MKLKLIVFLLFFFTSITLYGMLQQAVEDGDLKKIEELLQAGAHINEKDNDKEIALRSATQRATAHDTETTKKELYKSIINTLMVYADEHDLQAFSQNSIDLLVDHKKSFITWLLQGAHLRKIPQGSTEIFVIILLGMPNLHFSNFSALLTCCDNVKITKIVPYILERFSIKRIHHAHFSSLLNFLMHKLNNQDASAFLQLKQPSTEGAQESLKKFLTEPPFKNNILNNIELMYVFVLHHKLKMHTIIYQHMQKLAATPAQEITGVKKPQAIKPILVYTPMILSNSYVLTPLETFLIENQKRRLEPETDPRKKTKE